MRTRLVRFYPVEWFGKPCMRVEVYGIQVGKGEHSVYMKQGFHSGHFVGQEQLNVFA
jgi:hypothetical protein